MLCQVHSLMFVASMSGLRYKLHSSRSGPRPCTKQEKLPSAFVTLFHSAPDDVLKAADQRLEEIHKYLERFMALNPPCLQIELSLVRRSPL